MSPKGGQPPYNGQNEWLVPNKKKTALADAQELIEISALRQISSINFRHHSSARTQRECVWGRDSWGAAGKAGLEERRTRGSPKAALSTKGQPEWPFLGPQRQPAYRREVSNNRRQPWIDLTIFGTSSGRKNWNQTSCLTVRSVHTSQHCLP